MKCPTCNQKLTRFEYKGIKLDICRKCNSLWFDKNELRLVKDAQDEFLRWLDPVLWKHGEKFRISKSKRICPRDSVPLYETKYDGSDVMIDVCNLCQGVWLEKGEFDKIINHLKEKVSSENIRGYLKDISEEALEVFTGKEGFSSEVGDLLMVMKLLTYRIGARFSIITEIVKNLPK